METAGQSVADLIQQFVSGGRDASHLWRDLAGRGKLHQGLRELVAGAEAAIGPDPLSSLNRCWELLSQPEAEQQLHRYHLADHGVDVGRICRHARALVAVAQAGVALRQTISHPDAWERLLEWWRKAGELLTDSRLLPAAGVPSCGFDLTEPERLEAALECVVPFEWPVGALRMWTRDLLRLPDGSLHRLRIPILGVTAGDEGFVADLRLVLLNACGGDLIEEPETALRPFGGDLLRVLGEQHRRHAAANSISWTLTMRPTVHKPQFAWMALDGKSLGAAAAVGFHLLMHNGIYDGGCAITAAVGQSGGDPLEDELAGVEGLEAKLRALVAWNQENPQGVIRRVAVAARDDKRPAGIVERYAGSLQLTLLDKVGAAVQFASEEVEQLRQYLRELIEAPDREYIPGKPEGIKPSELYIEPDVFKRELRRKATDLQAHDNTQRHSRRFAIESLDIGERQLYGDEADEWQPRESWHREIEALRFGADRVAAILGPPGSGKTRLAAYTARYLAEEALQNLEQQRCGIESVSLPVVVPSASLSELVREAGESSEAVVKRMFATVLQDARCPTLAAKYMVDHLCEQRAWFFLDGLDELDETRRNLLNLLLTEVAKWRCRMVIMTRPYGWQTWVGLFGGWRVGEYRLAPLDDERIQTFIEHWFQDRPGRSTALQLVRSSSAVRALAGVPFLLVLLCAVMREWELKTDITRTELYARGVQILFGGPARALAWQKLLEEVAWAIFQRGGRMIYITGEELGNLIRESNYRPVPLGVKDASALSAQEKCDVLLNELEWKRILVPYAKGRAYVFPHRSIAEYLMGCALARRINSSTIWSMLERKAWEPEWAQAIRFFAGTSRPYQGASAHLMRLLADKNRDDHFRHRLGLAVECMKELSVSQRTAICPNWNELAYDCFSVWWSLDETLESAADHLTGCLLDLATSDILAVITQALTSPDWDDRQKAVRALQLIGPTASTEIAPVLLGLLDESYSTSLQEGDDDNKYWVSCAQALAALKPADTHRSEISDGFAQIIDLLDREGTIHERELLHALLRLSPSIAGQEEQATFFGKLSQAIAGDEHTLSFLIEGNVEPKIPLLESFIVGFRDLIGELSQEKRNNVLFASVISDLVGALQRLADRAEDSRRNLIEHSSLEPRAPMLPSDVDEVLIALKAEDARVVDHGLKTLLENRVPRRWMDRTIHQVEAIFRSDRWTAKTAAEVLAWWERREWTSDRGRRAAELLRDPSRDKQETAIQYLLQIDLSRIDAEAPPLIVKVFDSWDLGLRRTAAAAVASLQNAGWRLFDESGTAKTYRNWGEKRWAAYRVAELGDIHGPMAPPLES